MVELQKVKPGDLIISHNPAHKGGGVYSEAVVIEVPTGETRSRDHLILHSSTTEPEIMYYSKFPGYDYGRFSTMNELQWKRDGQAKYIPRAQNENLSRRLLQDARTDLTRPVYKSRTSLKDLGFRTENAEPIKNAEKVLNTIEALL